MAANWKMYKTGAEAAATVKEMAEILNHEKKRIRLIFHQRDQRGRGHPLQDP